MRNANVLTGEICYRIGFCEHSSKILGLKSSEFFSLSAYQSYTLCMIKKVS